MVIYFGFTVKVNPNIEKYYPMWYKLQLVLVNMYFIFFFAKSAFIEQQWPVFVYKSFVTLYIWLGKKLNKSIEKMFVYFWSYSKIHIQQIKALVQC